MVKNNVIQLKFGLTLLISTEKIFFFNNGKREIFNATNLYILMITLHTKHQKIYLNPPANSI